MSTTVLAAALVGVAVLAARAGAQPMATAHGARRLLRRAGSQRSGAGRRAGRWLSATTLLTVLDMVAAQVRAGAEPVTAWAAAVELCDAPLSTTEPVAALRGLVVGQAWPSGPQRGVRAATADAAAAAAAAWDLAQTTGAPLAGLLDSVARTVRAERDDRAAVEAALAGPRATARLLLALPVAGIGLGELVGAHPVGVLLTSAPGRACAAGGAALLVAGRWWMRGLVNAVERAGRPASAAVVVSAGSS